MACFLVPAGEAVVVTIVKKVQESKEPTVKESEETVEKIPFSQKLHWLTNLLWGGAILLAFEHLWHGEVVPFPPFLSAMNDPADTAEMLHEMGTVGVTMAIIITAVWIVMCFAADAIVKRPAEQKQNA